MAQTNENHHRLTSRWARAVSVATVKSRGVLAAAALSGMLVVGGSAAASTTGPSERAVLPAGSADELRYLIRLARNAEPASAAHFRLIEEIDRLVWTTESGVR